MTQLHCGDALGVGDVCVHQCVHGACTVCALCTRCSCARSAVISRTRARRRPRIRSDTHRMARSCTSATRCSTIRCAGLCVLCVLGGANAVRTELERRAGCRTPLRPERSSPTPVAHSTVRTRRAYSAVRTRPCVLGRAYSAVRTRPCVLGRAYSAVRTRPCVLGRAYSAVRTRPCVRGPAYSRGSPDGASHRAANLQRRMCDGELAPNGTAWLQCRSAPLACSSDASWWTRRRSADEAVVRQEEHRAKSARCVVEKGLAHREHAR